MMQVRREQEIKGVLCDVKVPGGSISMDGIFLRFSALWKTEDAAKAIAKNEEWNGGSSQKETASKPKQTLAVTVGGDDLFLAGETALL